MSRERVYKDGLVSCVARKTGSTKVLVDRVIEEFLETIVEELENGKEIQITNFGIFELKECSVRMARDLNTGEAIEVPVKTTPRFKVSKAFKNRVEKAINGGFEDD